MTRGSNALDCKCFNIGSCIPALISPSKTTPNYDNIWFSHWMSWRRFQKRRQTTLDLLKVASGHVSSLPHITYILLLKVEILHQLMSSFLSVSLELVTIHPRQSMNFGLESFQGTVVRAIGQKQRCLAYQIQEDAMTVMHVPNCSNSMLPCQWLVVPNSLGVT